MEKELEVSILTRAFARVQRGFILVCVLDEVQEGVCANPSESASDAGWRGVKQIRVFNVP
jgi:hypothetical protein